MISMLIWGNKNYVVDKLIEVNGLDRVRKNLAALVWDEGLVDKKWDHFRQQVKGMAPP